MPGSLGLLSGGLLLFVFPFGWIWFLKARCFIDLSFGNSGCVGFVLVIEILRT